MVWALLVFVLVAFLVGGVYRALTIFACVVVAGFFFRNLSNTELLLVVGSGFALLYRNYSSKKTEPVEKQ